jgi:arylsulfatase A-like enzyme
LTPFLTGERDDSPHDVLYWRQVSSSVRAIRSKDLKLTQPKGSGEPMLFDLASDLGESENLASGNRRKLADLDTLWQHWNEQLVEPAFLGLTERDQYWKQWKK